MKRVIITTAFMVASFLMVVRGQECNSCNAFMKKLGAVLVLPGIIKIELEFFKDLVCEGDAMCTQQVDEYWPNMAQAIFKHPNFSIRICSGSPALCGLIIKDCMSCSQSMIEINNVFQNPAFQKDAVDVLSGPVFCSKVPDPQRCAAFVQKYAGKAISLAGQVFGTDSGITPCETFPETSCRPKKFRPKQKFHF